MNENRSKQLFLVILSCSLFIVAFCKSSKCTKTSLMSSSFTIVNNNTQKTVVLIFVKEFKVSNVSTRILFFTSLKILLSVLFFHLLEVLYSPTTLTNVLVSLISVDIIIVKTILLNIFLKDRILDKNCFF